MPPRVGFPQGAGCETRALTSQRRAVSVPFQCAPSNGIVDTMVSRREQRVTWQARLGTRRLWSLALAVAAIAIAGVSVATASGLLDFRDPQPGDAAFPNRITCPQGTGPCTAGVSAGGHVFALFKVGESATDAQVVGAGVDTGDGKQITPLICTRSGGDVQCGSQPPGGEKQLALYLPG